MEYSQNNASKWYCPKCGVIPQEKIVIYNENLKKQRISVLPILPTCQFCGSEIIFNKSQLSGKRHRIIALTGTCASGKTSIAEILMKKYGFYAIDGDSAMNIVKHKLGITKFDYNGTEMFNEITHQIDTLLLLEKDIVISHVVLPGDIPKFRDLFQSRGLIYQFFLLHPNYESALSRSMTRTCFNGITPEEWVRYFYDELSVLKQQKISDVTVFDNSDCSIEESAKEIVNIIDNR